MKKMHPPLNFSASLSSTLKVTSFQGKKVQWKQSKAGNATPRARVLSAADHHGSLHLPSYQRRP